jgi:protein phosphatase
MVAHVGDSRAYHISPEGTITQITTDHSFVQALLDAKQITEEQAETHPMGHILYRALGQNQRPQGGHLFDAPAPPRPPITGAPTA